MNRQHLASMNASTPDLLASIERSQRQLSDTNHRRFLTTVTKDGSYSLPKYQHSLHMELSLPNDQKLYGCDHVESSIFCCPSSLTRWKVVLEPTDTAAGQLCITVRLLAVDLALAGTVVGHFRVTLNPSPRMLHSVSSKTKSILTGGAVWRLGEARGHVVAWRRDLEKAAELNLQVDLEFSVLDLRLLVDPSPNVDLHTVSTLEQNKKCYSLSVHWKIKGFKYLKCAPATVLHSPCFGVVSEEVVFRLLLYPEGALCDSNHQVRVALHLLHLPDDVRASGMRVEFALGLATDGRKIPKAVKRADQLFTESSGWGFRFEKRSEYSSADGNVSIRGDLRFGLPLDNTDN